MSETDAEQLDRNLRELIEELRVALPGVQVLFAFLLVAPFNQRFSDLSTNQERLYLVALVFAGLASACLLAPTAHHRFTFRLRDKPAIIHNANRFAMAGIVCLAVSMTSAIGLVTGFVFDEATAIVTTAVLGGTYSALWVALPLWRRRHREAREPRPDYH